MWCPEVPSEWRAAVAELSDHFRAGSYLEPKIGPFGIIRWHGSPVEKCRHARTGERPHTTTAEARACAQEMLDRWRNLGTNPCRDHFPWEHKGLLIDGEFYPPTVDGVASPVPMDKTPPHKLAPR